MNFSHERGGMAERLKAAVLKTASRVIVTGVRIPLPPPFFRKIHTSQVASSNRKDIFFVSASLAINTDSKGMGDPDEQNL
jgi:hypothetical protein